MLNWPTRSSTNCLHHTYIITTEMGRNGGRNSDKIYIRWTKTGLRTPSKKLQKSHFALLYCCIIGFCNKHKLFPSVCVYILCCIFTFTFISSLICVIFLSCHPYISFHFSCLCTFLVMFLDVNTISSATTTIGACRAVWIPGQDSATPHLM